MGGWSSGVDLSGTYEHAWGVPTSRWIWPPAHGTNTFAFSDGEARCIPLPIHANTTFDRIACEITTAGTTGAVVRLGVYANSGNDTPEGLLFDAGTVDGTTTGIKSITIDETIGAGLVWLLAVNQGGASTPAELREANSMITPFFAGNSVTFTVSGRHAVSKSGVTGSLPDPFDSANRDVNPPFVALRAT